MNIPHANVRWVLVENPERPGRLIPVPAKYKLVPSLRAIGVKTFYTNRESAASHARSVVMPHVPDDIPDGVDPMSYIKPVPNDHFSSYTLEGGRLYVRT